MLNRVVIMYATMLSTILAGILNMIFTKTAIYKNNRYPIDMNKTFIDGKRILGDNKTYIGFISMILFNIVVQIVLGQIKPISNISEFYKYNSNSIGYNIKIGALLGLAYMLCELPNSFIKRRINIVPGKTSKGILGGLFFIIDQVDSMLGVILVLAIYARLSIYEYIEYIILGGCTHIAVNVALHKLKIRKNI